MLCWLAAMTVLPAMISCSTRSASPTRRRPPWTFTAACACCTQAAADAAFDGGRRRRAGHGGSKVWYDDNLLNLQAVGLESVELERKLLTETNQSSWFALSVAKDAAEALRLKAAFSDPKLKSVERVEELAEVLPTQEAQVLPIIERIYQRLAGLPQQAPAIPSPSPAELLRVLAAMARGRPPGQKPGGARKWPRWGRFYAACRRKNSAGGWPGSSSESPPTCWGGWPCCGRRRQSRPAHAGRPPRQPRLPLHRPQRQIPAEELRQERHLGHSPPAKPSSTRSARWTRK